ncbi:UDP-N-acetylmuramate dehydrogenase [Leucobacter sp. M11]|uniref:UDP-N-acetylmuramate dehydrogenase n=1 Tax=Leucobacter sp. M11 TaxID=2993565 RepID=UPI002D80EA18|nr:UDP-N-acetylmuramate dehydrogenase [Leucobacter sp. M11]MEB4615174.1 UDP-N-acetylmuramate dehydrogenase [Leucobacter sp. M11]
MTPPGESAPGTPVTADTPLSELTTMRVGGRAREILTATTSDDLVRIASELWARGEDWLLLAGGSNTVVADEGFDGPVLLVRNEGIERLPDPAPGQVRLRVQAGQDWDQLVGLCVDQGWAGIEALSGIPGCAGAAPVQNIGAYGQELSSSLHAVTFLDEDTGEVTRIPAAELGLGYRTSVFKRGRGGVVLSIDLTLSESGAVPSPLSAPVGYAQLADALGVRIGDRVSIKELRRTVLRLRASKGMVLDPEDRDSTSAGSFFTNPIVPEAFARTLPADAPRWSVTPVSDPVSVTPLAELDAGEPMRRVTPQEGPRLVKLSAAWLIERSGIARGYRIPGSRAAISAKHTLAITNQGGATAAEVGQLARFVVQRVQADFGVLLHPEPNLVGIEL